MSLDCVKGFSSYPQPCQCRACRAEARAERAMADRRALLTALVKCDPVYDGECALCGVCHLDRFVDGPEKHAPDCPWRMAKQMWQPPTGICSAHQRGEDPTCSICYPQEPEGNRFLRPPAPREPSSSGVTPGGIPVYFHHDPAPAQTGETERKPETFYPCCGRMSDEGHSCRCPERNAQPVPTCEPCASCELRHVDACGYVVDTDGSRCPGYQPAPRDKP